LREQRGPLFVTTIDQLRLLLEYGWHLLSRN
jgi:hypothetical protein